MSGERNVNVRHENIDVVCGARSARRRKATGTRTRAASILTCLGLTSACGFCAPTLSRDARNAARDAPPSPPEHTQRLG
jgi:hypothetical protein